jgi:hypothetical protein
MARLTTKLRQMLERRFPGATAEIHDATDVGKIYGFLVWKGFGRLDPLDRHQLIDDTLDAHLSETERRRISVVFAYTPREMANVRANASEPVAN